MSERSATLTVSMSFSMEVFMVSRLEATVERIDSTVMLIVLSCLSVSVTNLWTASRVSFLYLRNPCSYSSAVAALSMS